MTAEGCQESTSFVPDKFAPDKFQNDQLSVIAILNHPGQRVFEMIGRGTMGMCISAIVVNNPNRARVVIKQVDGNKMKIKVEGMANPEYRFTRIDRELDLMRRLKHPNIVQFIDHYECKGFYYFVVERMDISLGRYYETLGPTEKRQHMFVCALLAQLLRAAEYLNRMDVIHGDINPNNIGLNPSGFIIKLFNFGISRETPTAGIPTGNLLYQAPEVYYGYHNHNLDMNKILYTTKVDLWGIAVTVIEMIIGRKLFEKPPLVSDGGTSELRQSVEEQVLTICGLPEHKHEEIYGDSFTAYTAREPTAIAKFVEPTRLAGEIPSMGCTNQNFYGLMGEILKIDPRERWDASKCLEHPYVSSMANYSKSAKKENISVKKNVLNSILSRQNTQRYWTALMIQFKHSKGE